MNVTMAGSRLRSVTQKCNQVPFPVTQRRNQGRFLVTLGYESQLHSPVPGYVWLRKSVMQPASRLRMVTKVG